jgi:hypothetical protein
MSVLKANDPFALTLSGLPLLSSSVTWVPLASPLTEPEIR